MKTQSVDTSPEAERVLIDRIRTASVAKRFRFVQSWSAAIIEAGRLDVQGLHPSATNEEVRLLYAQRQYGQEIAQQLQVAWHKQPEHHSSFPDLLQTLTPFMLACEHQHVTYGLSGSLASSLYGMQRATLHIHIMADLCQKQKKSLQELLTAQYLLCMKDQETSLEQESSFMLVHLETLLAIVLSLPKQRAFDQEMLHRSHLLTLVEGTRPFRVLSPEDLVLCQLEQFQQRRERADDIWYDLLGLLKVQGPALNLVELERWAAVLNLSQLLARALLDAGLREGEEEVETSNAR